MTDQHKAGVPSTASFAGHPLHAILVAFPISFLMGALATDLIFWWTANPFWARMSYWLIVAGLISGALAALTGLLDFITIERARRGMRDGWFHLLVNSAALALTLLNLLFRLQDMEAVIWPWGIVISAITAGLLGLGGWFGGELVYRYKIGVFGDVSKS